MTDPPRTHPHGVAIPTNPGDANYDRWRLAEWNALPNMCFIGGCETEGTDERGPVWLRDGSMHKACTEHWEPIMRVLGEQASWERADAMRVAP